MWPGQRGIVRRRRRFCARSEAIPNIRRVRLALAKAMARLKLGRHRMNIN